MAVLISLFAVGLRLRSTLSDPIWLAPLMMASLAMLITIGVLWAFGVGLGLVPGAALLLAAVLAPTDPVLASDVQVEHAQDRDRLRFSLTAEGGLNDGAAFPFVMLALGLLGLHEVGPYGLRWWGIDMLWATGAGLGLAIYLATFRVALTGRQRQLAAWFGIRGIGSMYYLAYAFAHGARSAETAFVADAVLVSIGLSVLLHGSSATPIMRLYRKGRPWRLKG